MIIRLPWPDRRLTPNAKRRKHWRAYQPAIKADRSKGRLLTLAAGPRAPSLGIQGLAFVGSGPIHLTITFYPPDKRRRDDDGMIGAFKHMRDGVADALGVDDNRFRVVYRFGEPSPPGRVEIEL